MFRGDIFSLFFDGSFQQAVGNQLYSETTEVNLRSVGLLNANIYL